MSNNNAMQTSIEVELDPQTTFQVFTEEVDRWWLQGPINFSDSTRAYEKRIEPGVGGRVMEVYDLDTGDGLELARITEWQPGQRLAWQSSLDDVAVEVDFLAEGKNTKVVVTATLAGHGVDNGGTAWLRMIPVWLPKWVTQRQSVARTNAMSRLAIALSYQQPARAARWLRDSFGFQPAGVIPNEEPVGDHFWIEFEIGDARIMIIGRQNGGEDSVRVPWIFVDDLDSQFEACTRAGATIVDPIWHHGARAFTVADLEGLHWTFAQASPRMLLNA